MPDKRNILVNIDYSHLIRTTLQQFCELLKRDKSTIMISNCKESTNKCPKGYYSHLCYELFFQISGRCKFEFVGDKISLNPEQIVIVPPETAHKESAHKIGDKPFRNLVLIIMPDGANIHIAEISNSDNDAPKPYFMEKLPATSTSYYYHTSEAICHLMQPRTTDNNAIANQMLLAMLMKIEHDLGAPTSTNVWETKLDLPKDGPYKIELVKEYVVDNILNDNLDVQRLAKMANYSPNYLSHLFKKTTGETLKAHINRKKMEAARVLLETTPYNVSEIAMKCGVQDLSYFSKLYKRYFGIKPMESRKGKN